MSVSSARPETRLTPQQEDALSVSAASVALAAARAAAKRVCSRSGFSDSWTGRIDVH